MFICGSGSFKKNDEDNEAYVSPCSTPKRSRRSTSFCRIMGRDGGGRNNPYADRGLEKFNALLADLDGKKQKIYTQKGSEDISFVRFVYANDSDNVKPIVVKVRERNSPRFEQRASFKLGTTREAEGTTEGEMKAEKTMKKKRSFRCRESFKMVDFRHPHFYVPVMVVLILLFLAIFGRSFAILCTSIGWYLTPTITGVGAAGEASERKPKRKKEYVRKRSEKIDVQNEDPSSPKSVINGLNQAHHQQHDRKWSW